MEGLASRHSHTHVAHPLVRAATVEFHSTVSERGAPSFPTGRTGGRDTEGTAQSSAPPYTARTRVCTALPPTLVFSRTPGYVLLSLWPHSALFRERSLLFHGVMYDKQEYRYWTREIIALQRRNEIKILPVSRARRRAPKEAISR